MATRKVRSEYGTVIHVTSAQRHGMARTQTTACKHRKHYDTGRGTRSAKRGRQTNGCPRRAYRTCDCKPNTRICTTPTIRPNKAISLCDDSYHLQTPNLRHTHQMTIDHGQAPFACTYDVCFLPLAIVIPFPCLVHCRQTCGTHMVVLYVPTQCAPACILHTF